MPISNIWGASYADYPPGTHFGPRITTSCEFVWLVSGAITWRGRRRGSVTDVSFAPGTVLLTRPETEDLFTWDSQGHTRHGFIHFDWSDEGEKSRHSEHWPTVQHHPGANVLIPLLDHVVACAASDDEVGSELADAGLRHALDCFIQGRGDLTPTETGVDGHPALARVWDAIGDLWKDGQMTMPNTTWLAHIAGVTPTHLGRLFRAHLGMSPAAALRLLRLDAAATLLTRSQLPIQGVAERCGFASAFHFSRRFRDVFKVPPSEMRSRVQAGGVRPMLPLARLRRLAVHLVH